MNDPAYSRKTFWQVAQNLEQIPDRIIIFIKR